jgi:hypothetical protein
MEICILPAGFLKLIQIHPQNYAFEVFENKRLYTMWDGGKYFMEYVFQPDVSLWPATFVTAMVYHIADFLALSNAQKPEYIPVIAQKALQARNMAQASDAQNRPQQSLASFPVLDDRHITASIGFNSL